MVRKKQYYKHLLIFCVSVLVYCICTASIYAETVHLKDGQIIKGKIVSQDATKLTIQTEFGTLAVDKKNISSVTFVEEPEPTAAPSLSANTSTTVQNTEPHNETVVHEKQKKAYGKNGVYMGLSLMSASITGEMFDGKHGAAFSNGNAMLVPHCDDGKGFQACIGIKKDMLGMEVGYEQSLHATSTMLPGKDDAESNIGSISLLSYFPHTSPLQMYCSVSGCYATLLLRNTLTMQGYKNVELKGLGAGLGAGVLVYVSPEIALQLGVTWRRIWYEQVTQGTYIGSPDKSLDVDMVSLHTGILFTF